jgi:hypothetical protein
MCINKEKIKCSILYDYVGGTSYVRNCITLSIFKAYFFYIMSYNKELKFVKDKKVAKRIIYDRYVSGQPTIRRIKHFMRYWSLRGLIIGFRWSRRLKNVWKEVFIRKVIG